MKYELYAVEVLVNSNPLTYDLARRESEEGIGSPLVWPTAEAAQGFIDVVAGGGDPDADARVVPLTGETGSENEPEYEVAVTTPEDIGLL